MSDDDQATPPDRREPTDETGDEQQQRQHPQRQQEQLTVLSMAQLQTMITDSVQAALPSLENAIATKVADSLQSQGKPPFKFLSSFSVCEKGANYYYYQWRHN